MQPSNSNLTNASWSYTGGLGTGTTTPSSTSTGPKWYEFQWKEPYTPSYEDRIQVKEPPYLTQTFTKPMALSKKEPFAVVVAGSIVSIHETKEAAETAAAAHAHRTKDTVLITKVVSAVAPKYETVTTEW